jgi:hypothetical protein
MPGRSGRRTRAPPATPASPAPLRQFLSDGVHLGVHGRDASPDGHLVAPLIRVQTPGFVRESVAVLGRAGAPGDPLQQLRVAPSQARGL